MALAMPIRPIKSALALAPEGMLMKRLKHPSAAKQAAENLYFAISHEGARLYRLRKNSILPLVLKWISFEGAWLYRLRKNSILPSVLKGHGFSHADKVNQISVGFSHRGTYFRIFGEIQPFSAPCNDLEIRACFQWVKTPCSLRPCQRKLQYLAE